MRCVNDISFTLDRGEMIVLTGVSGSGKSVLRLAMGFGESSAESAWKLTLEDWARSEVRSFSA